LFAPELRPIPWPITVGSELNSDFIQIKSISWFGKRFAVTETCFNERSDAYQLFHWRIKVSIQVWREYNFRRSYKAKGKKRWSQ
jgi:hypothetical protein